MKILTYAFFCIYIAQAGLAEDGIVNYTFRYTDKNEPGNTIQYKIQLSYELSNEEKSKQSVVVSEVIFPDRILEQLEEMGVNNVNDVSVKFTARYKNGLLISPPRIAEGDQAKEFSIFLVQNTGILLYFISLNLDNVDMGSSIRKEYFNLGNFEFDENNFGRGYPREVGLNIKRVDNPDVGNDLWLFEGVIERPGVKSNVHLEYSPAKNKIQRLEISYSVGEREFVFVFVLEE